MAIPTQPKPESSQNASFNAIKERLLKTVEARNTNQTLSTEISVLDFELVELNDREYEELEAIVGDSDQKFPRITYDSLKGKMRISYVPSHLHEEIAAQFPMEHAISRLNLTSEIRARTGISGSPRIRFTGHHKRTKLEPDAAFMYRNGQDRERKLSAVVEIGYSEPYESLREVASIWLNGQSTIQLVVLLKITETPEWTSKSSVGDRDLTQIKSSLKSEKLDFEQIEPRSDTIVHPLSFGNYGIPLINQMTMSLELWKRDASGKPTQNGNRMWYVPGCTDPLLKYGDLFPISKEDGGDVPFQLSWQKLEMALIESRLDFADVRYGQVRNWVRARESDSTDDVSDL
ncbi:MAG: hypothetical protein LQ340_006617 [Diploschistes diacapsis]|nr:MAG: hypothetical protein LQ340_006617 [Diploschistes diacapsis]